MLTNKEKYFRSAVLAGELGIMRFAKEKMYEPETICKAANRGHLHIVKYLIKKGANLKIQYGSLLYRAVKHKHYKIAILLIKCGAADDLQWAFNWAIKNNIIDLMTAIINKN